ncbi:MAG: hypothetical protein J6J21_01730 [Clostridia bacterium]|nr:hypothetical protein [Clostridia bacterium]
MSIGEKVAYLKGLIDGLKLQDTDEVRLIKSMADILSEVADELDTLRQDADTLNEYIEELDYDLGDLEEAIYGDECDCCDDDYCDCCDCDDDDCDCDCCAEEE